jgi:SIR2-like domain
MLIGKVDFPREVLDAQREGNLVIFAGAGVSMGSPANCPSFWELARDIGGKPAPDEKDEALDHYLGRLKKEKTPVHENARNILDQSPEPNLLHKELLKLFPSPDQVRLVTTNFDRHFSTAAKEVFPGKEVNTFYAPALPLGNDFEGIVYLHGSINHRPDRLVLTDSDFGKAYLTEGWATNFLKTLFSHYTVLFVGYSHEDIVVSYLARGLPPNNSSQRFAIVRDKDAEKRVQNWAHLGITVLTFPTIPEDTYSALENSIKKWADIAKMGFLDREQKIRRIVEALPP